MLITTGIPTEEDIESVMPPKERLMSGPVAITECFQKIPCNPCVSACAFKAIQMEADINSLPSVDSAKCTGCSACMFKCPGLAIFVVDMSYSEEYALVKVPYEYLPVPERGQYVQGLSRSGKELGKYRVAQVTSGGKRNKTWVIGLEVPKADAMKVRSFSEGGFRDGNE